MVKLLDIRGGVPTLAGAAIAAAGMLTRKPGLVLAGVVVGAVGLLRGTESEFVQNINALPELAGGFIADTPDILFEAIQRSNDRRLLPSADILKELSDRAQPGFVLGKPFNVFRIAGRIDAQSTARVVVRVENQSNAAHFGPVSLRVSEASALTGVRTAVVRGVSLTLQPGQVWHHEFKMPMLIGPPETAVSLTTSLMWRGFTLDRETTTRANPLMMV